MTNPAFLVLEGLFIKFKCLLREFPKCLLTFRPERIQWQKKPNSSKFTDDLVSIDSINWHNGCILSRLKGIYAKSDDQTMHIFEEFK